MKKMIMVVLLILSVNIYGDIFTVVIEKNHEEFNKIVKNYKDLNIKDKDGKTLLYYAVRNSDYEMVKYLVDYGADINYKDSNGLQLIDRLDSIILRASWNKTYVIEMEKILIENGSSLSKNYSKYTKLMVATIRNDYDEVNKLLEIGYNPNNKNKHGDIALSYALTKEKIKIANLLITHGTDINFINDNNGNSILQDVILNNNTSLAQIFIKLGSNLNHKNFRQTSLLMTSAYMNNVKLLKYFINTKVDIMSKDEYGKTAIEYAVMKDSVDAFRIISINELYKGQGDYINDIADEIAIFDSINILKEINLLKLPLKTRKKIINQMLVDAISRKSLKVIKYLRDYSYDLEYRAPYNESMEKLVYKSDSIDIFENLILKNNNDNSVKKEDYIKEAIMNNATEILEYLLSTEKNSNSELMLYLKYNIQNGSRFTFRVLKKYIKIDNFKNADIIKTALKYDCDYLVEELLKNKIMLDDNEWDLKAIFYSAVDDEKTDILKVFLDNGIYFDLRFEKNRNSYMKILTMYECDDLDEKAIKYVKNDGAVDIDGNTIFHYAVEYNKINVAKKLIDLEHNAYLENNFGKNIVELAKDNYVDVIIDYLMLKNLDIDYKTEYGATCLMTASMEGNIEVVKKLLKKGANPNYIDNNNRSALCFAIYNNNLEIVKLLMENGAKTGLLYEKEKSSFIVAALNNLTDVKIIDYLLSKSNDKSDYELITRAAINCNNLKIFKYMLNLGEYNIDYSEYWSVIIDSGDIEMLKFLEDKNINYNKKIQGWKCNYYPVEYALEKGKLKIVDYLLTKDLKGDNGENSLIYAIKFNRLEALKKLLEDISIIKNTVKSMAIDYALKSDNLEMLDLLIKKGFSLNIKISENETPLLYAIKSNNDELFLYIVTEIGYSELKKYDMTELINYSIKNNNNISLKYFLKILDNMNSKIILNEKMITNFINLKDPYIINIVLNNIKFKDDIKTLYEKTIKNNNRNLLIELQKKYSLINEININRWLLYAIENNSFDITHYLLYRGGDSNITDGVDPIIIKVVRDGKANILEMLILFKVDTKVRDRFGNTALLEAIKNKREKEALLLIKENSSVNIKNFKGFTPINFAALYNSPNIIKALLDSKKIKNEKIEIDKSIKIAKEYYAMDSLKFLEEYKNNMMKVGKKI